MITLEQFYMGRDKKWPPSLEMQESAVITVDRANELLIRFGEDRGLRSGYRPAMINALIPGAANNSEHMVCKAIDIEDEDCRLKAWCMDNLQILADIGLWMESPDYTDTWTHVQTIAPRSGNRVFIPFTTLPLGMQISKRWRTVQVG